MKGLNSGCNDSISRNPRKLEIRLGVTTRVLKKDLENNLVVLAEILQGLSGTVIKTIEVREGCTGELDKRELRKIASRYENLDFVYAIDNNCLNEQDSVQVKEAIEFSSFLSDKPILRLLAASTIIEKKKRRYTSKEIEKIIKRISEYTRWASKCGVTLALENDAEPMEDILYIVTKIKSPWLGINFDPGNLLLLPKPQDPIQTLGRLNLSHIKFVHLKQIFKGEAQSCIKEGDLNIDRLLSKLKEKGYKGTVCIEFTPVDDAMDALKKSIEYIPHRYFIS